jgi:hypothetical protein
MISYDRFLCWVFLLYRHIARKIIEDLMEYGNVQRAILGVEGGELNATHLRPWELTKPKDFTSVQ